MEKVKKLVFTGMNIILVTLAVLFFSMPALIPIHDWAQYRGKAPGAIVAVEYIGDRCAGIASFQADGLEYLSKEPTRINCKKEGTVVVYYDKARPERNTQTMVTPLVYSLLFFTGVLSGLTTWFIRKYLERKRRKAALAEVKREREKRLLEEQETASETPEKE